MIFRIIYMLWEFALTVLCEKLICFLVNVDSLDVETECLPLHRNAEVDSFQIQKIFLTACYAVRNIKEVQFDAYVFLGDANSLA